ncbi:hypothetical protein CNECB9_2370115 [Cupriavidus necator]|uniref:Uncharacterized protein n=1 Tax=Cupriavidus necator TaxID=106590 RepID=A0A1K0IDZ3_CUPNE|nr:hypothetical protein CNECB9_2370115 [Cupriavidus necator]
MNLREWLDATSIRDPNITAGESERRKIERSRVLKAANTSMSSLRCTDSRGRMGIDLAKRLEKATAGTSAEFKVVDQMPELLEEEVP